MYAQLPGVKLDDPTGLWMKLKSWPKVRVTWYTCDGDPFFGPSSVRGIVELLGKDRGIEVVNVPGASHSDIFWRTQVWEGMHKRIMDNA